MLVVHSGRAGALTPLAGFLVLLAWTVTASLSGYFVLRKRDV